jgi:fatty acid desaturase
MTTPVQNDGGRLLTRQQYKVLCAPPKWILWKCLANLCILVASILLSVRLRTPFQLLMILLAGSQILALYTAFHGASHGHLSKNKRVNEWAGILLGTLLCTTFHGYRACHMRHHRHLRQKEDIQEVIHNASGHRPVLAFLMLLTSILGAAVFIWIRVPYYGAKYAPRRIVFAEILLSISFYSFLILFLLPHEAGIPFLGSLLVALVWGSLLDITYHQGLPVSGGLESSRSMDCDVFGLWLLNGENRHAEHHSFPSIPGPNLMLITKLIRPQLEARGVVYESGYLRAFIKGVFLSPLFLPPKPEDPEEKGD